MKKRVNLFSKKKQQQPIPSSAFAIRSYGILFICICIFLSIVSGIWYYFKYQEYEKIAKDVVRLETTAKANTQIQGSIVFFVNKKEQLDAYVDIKYILLGGVNSSGLQEVFEEGFNLIHDNNMTKAHRDQDHCLNTIENLKKTGEQSRWGVNEKDGKSFI